MPCDSDQEVHKAERSKIVGTVGYISWSLMQIADAPSTVRDNFYRSVQAWRIPGLFMHSHIPQSIDATTFGRCSDCVTRTCSYHGLVTTG